MRIHDTTLHDAIDRLAPPGGKALLDDGFERIDLSAELTSLEPQMGVKQYNIEVHARGDAPKTLAQLARKVELPMLGVTTSMRGMPPYGHVLQGTPVHRFIRCGVRHYADILPGLTVRRARVQVITDTLDKPNNSGGLTAHTDSDPTWAPEFERTDALILCASVTTADPGTHIVRLRLPVDTTTPVGHLIKHSVLRNYGPKPETFMRAARRTQGAVSVTHVKGGDMGHFSGQTIHWRGTTDDAPARARRRRFAALDLDIPMTPRNRRIIRAALAKHNLKAEAQKPPRPRG